MDNKDELITALNAEYGLGLSEAILMRDGSDNAVWAVSGPETAFVARVSKRTVDDIGFEAEWLQYLKTNSVPVPTIVENKRGKAYSHLPDGKAVTIFSVVPGKHLEFDTEKKLPREAVIEAATALAKMHNVSRDHVVASPRQRTVYTEINRALSHEKEIAEQIPGGKEFLVILKKYLGMRTTGKPVLVHNDYRINNILFGELNQVSAILDFDWSCTGPAEKDVGHALAEWSFPDGAKTHRIDIFETFLDSYNKTAEEKIKKDDRLYEWIAFSCLSDTCTYITDRLERGELKSVSGSFMYKKFLYFRQLS